MNQIETFFVRAIALLGLAIGVVASGSATAGTNVTSDSKVLTEPRLRCPSPINPSASGFCGSNGALVSEGDGHWVVDGAEVNHNDPVYNFSGAPTGSHTAQIVVTQAGKKRRSAKVSVSSYASAPMVSLTISCVGHFIPGSSDSIVVECLAGGTGVTLSHWVIDGAQATWAPNSPFIRYAFPIGRHSFQLVGKDSKGKSFKSNVVKVQP